MTTCAAWVMMPCARWLGRCVQCSAPRCLKRIAENALPVSWALACVNCNVMRRRAVLSSTGMVKPRFGLPRKILRDYGSTAILSFSFLFFLFLDIVYLVSKSGSAVKLGHFVAVNKMVLIFFVGSRKCKYRQHTFFVRSGKWFPHQKNIQDFGKIIYKN